MKSFSTLVAVSILFFSFSLQAQTSKEKSNGLSDVKTDFIQQQAYLSKNTLKDYNGFYTDSLKGFEEASIKTELLTKGLSTTEYLGHLKHLKRQYIKTKYGLNPATTLITTPSNTKPLGGNNTINTAPCVNEGFESSIAGAYTTSNAVTGWTVSSRYADSQCNPTTWTAGSSEFALITTPIVHYSTTIGIIPQSPFGGTLVAQLNDYVPNTATTKIAQAIPVTTANTLFQFAYAGYWEDGGTSHLCCDAPMFNVYVKDCSGNSLSCLNVTLNPYTDGCTTGLNIYSRNGTASFTNWMTRSIDLTPFIGSCVIIEAVTYDCAFGGHYGTTFFDAVCGSQFAPTTSMLGTSLGGAVNMCSGSSYATIQAPVGYASYSWYGPNGILPASQGSTSVLTLTNAVANTVYTVSLLSGSGCLFAATYTLVSSSVGISGAGAFSTCATGSSGTAIVVGSGSGSGYTYSWVNSTNSVISTSSVAANLSSGNYTVSISAIGSPSCGSASSVVNVGIASPSITPLTKHYCGIEAVLSAATTGTNYQWYNNQTAISSTLGGTASSYTVSPVTNILYWLSYVTSQGCKDSLQFNLIPSLSGSISAMNLLPACNYTSSGGTGVITLTPAPGSPVGQNSFLVLSTGSTATYSSYVSASSYTNYTATNLASGTYSAIVTDGSCKYGTSFYVGVYASSNFMLTPSLSQTVCNGNSLLVNIALQSSNTPSQFTYSWSPSNFVLNPTAQQTYITPTVSPGTYSTLIYTAQVTSTAINCPETKTLSITVANLLPPVINPIPQLCTNSSTYIITGIPSGGSFTNNLAISSSGILSPTLASSGVNNFTYTVHMGTCSAASSGSFNIGIPPTLNISGNTSFCKGQSTTLLAAGATSYTWNNVFISPYISVSPIVTTNFTIVGFSSLNSCTNSAIITVTVMSLPTVTIAGPATLCAGGVGTLSASGANSFLWNTGATTQTIAVSPTSTSIFTVQGANATNECFGMGSISISVSVCADTTTTDPTGLHNLSIGNGLSVYPNPGSGKFIIETATDVEINLCDAVGKLILQDKIRKGNYSFDLSSYASGVYILKVTRGDEAKTIKLVKNN